MKHELIKELSRIRNRNVKSLVEEVLAPQVISDINDYAGGMMRHIQIDMNDKEALAAMELLEEMHVKELISFLRGWIQDKRS